MLYDYFKQLFAQVTNPPIDSIREEIVTSAETRLGSEGNLLNPQPTACRRVELKWPVLTNEEFGKIRRTNLPGLRVGVLPILFRVARGEKGLGSDRRSRDKNDTERQPAAPVGEAVGDREKNLHRPREAAAVEEEVLAGDEAGVLRA